MMSKQAAAALPVLGPRVVEDNVGVAAGVYQAQVKGRALVKTSDCKRQSASILARRRAQYQACMGEYQACMGEYQACMGT